MDDQHATDDHADGGRGSESGTTGQSGRRRFGRRGRRKQLPLWQETLVLLGIALVLAVIIKALFVQAFYIPSESMEPGLVKNDRILVQKVSYWGSGAPQRGDVVVFKDPGGWLNAAEAGGPTGMVPKALAKIGLYPTGGHLVKRVIGVEGDVISCCDKQGRIKVNGVPLDESDYIKLEGADCDGPMVNQCRRNWKVGPIPEGDLFVMGDNRNNSADSSHHICTKEKSRVEHCDPDDGDEYVPVQNVVGKVFVVLWPADHFRWVTRPDAFSAVEDAS